MLFGSPIPFDEALQSRKVKALLPTALKSAEIMQFPAQVRERAMLSAQTLSAEYLQSISDKVETMLNPKTVLRDGVPVTQGLDTATARLELKKFLQGISYTPPSDKAGTIEDLSSDGRLNLVLKMNVQMAQGYGNWKQGQDATVLDEFPAQELFRAEARKVPREWIERWRGAGGKVFAGGDGEKGRMIALKNDPIWTEISAFGLPYPPFDFNSGMDVRDVDRGEAIALGLIDRDTKIEPQSRGFEMEVAA